MRIWRRPPCCDIGTRQFVRSADLIELGRHIADPAGQPAEPGVLRSRLVESLSLALDNGSSWHDIAALATSPEQAELRYSSDSPVVDSRWPYDY